MKLIFATHNPNKVNEIQALLPEHIQILSLNDLDYHKEIVEHGETIEANAKIKADTISDLFDLPCFADDTGLEVNALGGKPGVKSARYAGQDKSDEANKKKLLKELKGKEDRSARFKTVIVFKNGDEEKVFTGLCEGEITKEPAGKGGFGYDPIFKPKRYSQTFAEMPASEKNKISHRGLAFQQLIEFLKA
ncbi:RdgB/HAM1 family non-canonical purine NTP pyrophosphatase [Psychroflexus sp. CAK57W]|uniref:RdgB/HAM1 family non-canonical purine NTP pyrophosphatase n=1 Tax=Psychroflexus curvus TaxID=2873595 RepID=UPI001CCFE0E9|nr:RdgB/HAM1 family non-canonical purine NTP pyrophosphatase [Psychroflexus curvus]MBZ9628596.1 RdgB/HAM1 family non-canonical purine NTP pyrophosphatase [Psychroflexus curvus]MBZ9787957.1 RdgB/HAM1 family non-canonical purine NTP pyrophosphatase [Psychroflexus curvus]